MGDDYGQIGSASVGLDMDLGGFGKLLDNARSLFAGSVEAMGGDFKDGMEAVVGEGGAAFLAFAGVAVAAIAGVTAAIVEMGESGSKVNDVRDGFDRLSGGIATASDNLQAMRQGTAGTVSDMDLMTQANKLLAVGAVTTSDQFGTLTEASRVLSHEGFGPTQDVLQSLSTAMETGRTRRMALMGVTVDAKAAEESYAESLGIQATDLSTSQKLIADRQAVMAALQQTVAGAGEQEVTFEERIQQGEATVKNWINSLDGAVAASPVLRDALDGIGQAFTIAFGTDSTSSINSVTDLVEKFSFVVIDVGEGALQVANIFIAAWSGIQTLVLGIETGFVGFIAELEHGYASVVDLAGEFPKLTGVTSDQVAVAKNNAAAWDAMTLSLEDQTAEASKGVTGNSALNKTIDAMGGALEAAKDKMADHLAEQEKLRESTEQTGFLEGDTAPWLKKQQADQDAAEASAKHEAAVAKLLGTLTGESTQVSVVLDAFKALTPAQRENTDVQAALIPVVDKLVASHQQVPPALMAWYSASIQARDALTDQQTAMLLLDSTTYQRIQTMKSEGDSEQEIATRLGVTTAALKQYEDEQGKVLQIESAATTQRMAWVSQLSTTEDKYFLQRLKDTSDSITQTNALWAQYYQIQVSLSGTTADAQIAAVDAWLADETAKLKTDDEQWQRHYDALVALAGAKIEAIQKQNDPLFQAWKSTNADMRTEWASTWDAALNGTTTFSAAVLQPFTDIENGFKKMLAGMLADYEQQLLGPLLDSIKGSLGSLFGQSSSTAPIGPGLPMPAAAKGGVSAAGVIGAAAGGAEMLQNQSLGSDVLGGVTMGASIGSMVPGVGTLVGAGVGAVVGGLEGIVTSLMGVSQAEKDARSAFADFEQKADSVFSTTASGQEKLTAGQDTFKQMTMAVGDAFALEGKTGDQANQALTTVLDATHQSAAAVASATQDINTALAQLASLGDNAKTSATDLGHALTIPATAMKQLAADQAALTTATGAEAVKLAADATTQAGIIQATAVKTQASASAMAASVVANFDSMLKSGMSFTDAVTAVDPAVQGLQAQMTAAGLAGGAAFNLLQGQVALAHDAIAGPALQAVQQLTSGMTALSQTGKLDQETFNGLAGQITQTFTSLVAQGQDGGAVMEAMQDPLQQLWELEQQYGFQLDDSTQALLDQAQQAGIVGEKNKSSTQQMVDGVNAIDTDLKQLIESLTGVGTTAANAFAKIPSKVVTQVETHYVSSGSPPDFSTDPIPMAAGGMGHVDGPTLFVAGEAGGEDYAFSGAGRSFGDSPSFLGSSAPPSTPGGGPSGAQSIIIMLDSQVLTRTVVRGFPEELRLAGLTP